jgi:hypothetical protein
MKSLPRVPSLQQVARRVAPELSSFSSRYSRAGCHSCTIASLSTISTEFVIRGVYCQRSIFFFAGSASYRLGSRPSFPELSAGHSFGPVLCVTYFLSPPAPFSSSQSLTPVMQSSSLPFYLRRATPNGALGGFSVRRTPRACHGACDHLRPGRLRASHAVCLASRTLEPVFCARKRGEDIESISTTERIRSQIFVMRSLSPSFRTDSVRTSSASSTNFSDSFSHPLRSEETPNNGAAENRSGRLRSVTACASASGASADSGRFSCAPPLGTGCASPQPPSAVSELESFGHFAALKS